MEPRLRKVVMWMCDLCINGDGTECHVPGCVLWMNRPPAHSIRFHTSMESIDGAAVDHSKEGE